ncbi:WbuC family cupin fold metalloprotein [Undibacterium sp. Jales W-56]|uniref:WbuC family cupin fold metalloprotein n=1 Tax=Undibacterium sp. Jales W-56 TaxID=2897325 RepID=UPI0021CFF16B|nr:WbuC family cupin fold metalloprotein [Undibacterium sp. Jales W-56]MCU6435621.1 WbuC family cupin fold metalloprotein [Undibacterium sp. Jales W-56]
MTNLITRQTLAELTQAAKDSPRLRKNLNFHTANDSACHRLLNALEPGTYIAPHRHLSVEKDETIIVMSGRFGVLLFDAQGSITETVVLSNSQENQDSLGITIPAGVFHSMVALESGSVFFESKAGPYAAFTEEEKAHWAPLEGDPACAAYLHHMMAQFDGSVQLTVRAAMPFR